MHAEGEDQFVVIDTAPTGHTLLLLDAAEAYHREVLRKASGSPDGGAASAAASAGPVVHLEQRIHFRHEGLTFGILAGQVPADDIIGDRKEPTMGTLRALDAGLLADATHPLVRASGRIAGLACLPALESARIHVAASAEE